MEWHGKIVPRLLAYGCRASDPRFSGEVRVNIVYSFGKRTGGRCPDLDNLVPKHIIDAMRGYVFPDDGPAYVVELFQRLERGAKSDSTTIEVVEIA